MLIKSKLYLLLCLTCFAFITGCGKNSNERRQSANVNTQPISIKQFDTPPGADPSVTAEQGGNGFTGEGWQTNDSIHILGSTKAVKGGILNMSIPDFPATLRNVGKDENSYFSRMAAVMMYESLLGSDHVNGEYTPALATHWKIEPDKLTYKYRINPNARWADGKPVTAEDVVVSWKLRVDEGILSPGTNELYKKYETPIAESKYIVSVKAKEMDWRLFVYFSGMAILPAHYIGGMDGKTYLEKYQFEVVPGSGPYTIDKKDISKGQSISIRRRSDYWAENEKFNAGLNNFDIIKFDVINDPNLEFEKFKKGDIDVISLQGVTRVDKWNEGLDIDFVKRGLIQKREVFNEGVQGVRGLAFNMRKAPFDDLRVRKAFAIMFDRDRYIEKLYKGAAVPLNSFYPNTVYENPDNPKTKFNIEEAQKLLTEAGWTQKNSDGYLVKDGRIFEVELPFGSPPLERFLTIYQEDMKKIGVKINLKQVDGTTNFKLGNERNFSILVAAWGGLSIPNPESSLSSKSADEVNSTNWPGFKDARVDELIKQYNTEFDRNKRIQLVREMDKIYSEAYPYAYSWYYPAERIVFHNKFGYPDWYLPKSGDNTDYLTIPYIWYYDAEKVAQYEEAKKDNSKTMEIGPLQVKYWTGNKQ